MKKTFFLIVVFLIVSLNFNGYSQKVVMTNGVPIKIEKIKNRTIYTQDGKQLKFTPMCKTLGKIDASAANIAIANKHGRKSGILIGVGILTFPIGYAIIIVPFINQKKKQIQYVELGIEDYNKYLASGQVQ